MIPFKPSKSKPTVLLVLICLCMAAWNSLIGTITINTNCLTNVNTNYVASELASQVPIKCDMYMKWDGSGNDGDVLTTNIVMANLAWTTNWGSFYFNSQASNNIQTTNSVFYSTNVGFNLGHVFNVLGTNYSNPLSGGCIFKQTNDINLALRFGRTVTSISAMFKIRFAGDGTGSDDHDFFTINPTASGEGYTLQFRDGTGVSGTQKKLRIERFANTTIRGTDMNVSTNALTICVLVNAATATNIHNAYMVTAVYSNDVFQTLSSNLLMVGSDNGGPITNAAISFKEILALAGKASEKTSLDTNWCYWSDIALRFKTNVNDGPAKMFTPNECSVRADIFHVDDTKYCAQLEDIRQRNMRLSWNPK